MCGLIASPLADAIWRGVLCLRKMAPSRWGITQYIDLVAFPSVLVPEPPTPDSPQSSSVHSALLLLEPRVNGYKWNFVCGPFEKPSESPVISPWQIETSLLFTAICYLGSFLGSGDIGWGAKIGV